MSSRYAVEMKILNNEGQVIYGWRRDSKIFNTIQQVLNSYRDKKRIYNETEWWARNRGWRYFFRIIHCY